MKTEKAKTKTFQYAGLEIEGLVMPDGSYRIALAQVRRLILAEKNYSIKQLEALSNIVLSAEKVSSDLNANKVITLSLLEFAKVCFRLSQANGRYPNAELIAEASIEFTIMQAMDVACGIEKTNIEGVAFYEAKVKSIRARRSLTDNLKIAYELTGAFPAYGHHTYMIYEALGIKDLFKAYRAIHGARNQNVTFRHHYVDEDTRFKIMQAETNIMFMIKNLGMSLEEALTKL